VLTILETAMDGGEDFSIIDAAGLLGEFFLVAAD